MNSSVDGTAPGSWSGTDEVRQTTYKIPPKERNLQVEETKKARQKIRSKKNVLCLKRL